MRTLPGAEQLEQALEEHLEVVAAYRRHGAGAERRDEVEPERVVGDPLACLAGDERLLPLLRVLLERDPSSLWVDVLAGDDAGRDLVEPALGVELAVEVAGVLLAVEVAVAGPPFAVGALLDVRQVASPLGWLSVVAAALNVLGEGAGVALVAHEAKALFVDGP